jgi:integrase/recombinase XerD
LAKRAARRGQRASAWSGCSGNGCTASIRHTPRTARRLIPHRARRSRPYIYSVEEIANIVAAAAELPSVHGLRGLTCSNLLGLLSTTGLRISEALALDAGDVDLKMGVLTIRRGKRGTARLVPIDSSVAQRLRNYAGERDRLLGFLPQPFSVGDRGARIGDCSARYNFALVCQRLGLQSPQRSTGMAAARASLICDTASPRGPEARQPRTC